MIASADGNGWFVAWLSRGEGGQNYLSTQRFDQTFNPISTEQKIGRAKGGQYQIHSTSSGFIVLWINQRGESLVNEGIYLLSYTLDGDLMGEPIELNQTFDAISLDSDWEDAIGGALIYTRPSGVYAQAYNMSGISSVSHMVSSERGRVPQVTSAGGAWGSAWFSSGDSGETLNFMALNEEGQPVGELKQHSNLEASGSLGFVYGNGSYGVAWSHPDPLSMNRRWIVDYKLSIAR